MTETLKDPMFFYSIAFVIFIGLAYRFGKKPLLAWIDSEILKVREELEQANSLRREAEATLAEYQAKQAAALADASAILQNAKEEAVLIKTEAEAELARTLARQEQVSQERIRVAEAEAASHIRNAAIDMAMKLARETLAKNIDETTAAKLIDQAIADIPSLASMKAQAA